MSTERVISIYSSRGGAKKITTAVTTWGELLPLVKKEGYPVSDLHVSENVRKSTLEHADAILPEGDFTLFMRPKKTKSGAKKKRADGLAKKDLIVLIKEDIASFDNAKEYYAGYSSKGVQELANLVNSFKGKNKPAPKESKTAKAAPKKEVAKPAVKKTSPAKKAEPVAKTSTAKKAPAKKNVADVVKDVKESKEEMEKRLAEEAKAFERGLL